MVQKKFFNYSVKVFKVFRVWSYQKADNRTMKAIFLKWVTIICSGVILSIISLSETIESLQYNEMAVSFNKGVYFYAISTFGYKVFAVAFRDNEISACIKKLQILSCKFKDTSDIEKCLGLYRKLFIVGVCVAYTCCNLLFLSPLTTAEARSLPFKPSLPLLDTKKTPNWHLLYIIEVIALLVLTTISLAYDTLFCGMMCLCSGILRSTCREIREFENFIEDHPISDIKIKETIDKINEITQVTNKISDTFSMTTMTHMMYNCITLTLGLLMVTVLPFGDMTFILMIAVLVLGIFQLWIYCYFGQNVVSQREVLRRELCFIRWYDASQNFKTMLLLTICESQNDRYVYAGKVVPLSLETFAEMVKRAYAFFTFMNESR